MREIPYVNLQGQFAEERGELLPIIESILAGGQYVGGSAVEVLEARLCQAWGAAHAVALNSGTDALVLGMIALGVGPGDEVITAPNSFIASAAAIVRAGARPVFADVQPDQNIDPDAIEKAITPRTKAIMPVHLTGRCADMKAIMEIARHHGLKVIEDAAQSVGSKLHGRFSGTLGDMGAFSAHPLKNLNACGDGGFLLTGDEDAAQRVRRLRNHGLIDRNTAGEFGYVSRMDDLQAAILTYRLEKLEAIITQRRGNAALYFERLADLPVFAPPEKEGEFNTYHTFVIQVERRDTLREYLQSHGIGTAIHYPVPIHLQPAARDLGYGPGDFPVTEQQAEKILTLPINQSLGQEDIAYICDTLQAFYAPSGETAP